MNVEFSNQKELIGVKNMEDDCGCGQEFRAFGHFETDKKGEHKITWCTKCRATYKDGKFI